MCVPSALGPSSSNEAHHLPSPTSQECCVISLWGTGVIHWLGQNFHGPTTSQQLAAWHRPCPRHMNAGFEVTVHKLAEMMNLKKWLFRVFPPHKGKIKPTKCLCWFNRVRQEGTRSGWDRFESFLEEVAFEPRPEEWMNSFFKRCFHWAGDVVQWVRQSLLKHEVLSSEPTEMQAQEHTCEITVLPQWESTVLPQWESLATRHEIS